MCVSPCYHWHGMLSQFGVVVVKKLFVSLVLSFFGLSALAQGLGEETYMTSPEPWNGDWLQERLDQMVNGEEFNGFPGPLPKMWFALGMDPNHPSVEYELRERVNRDSPFWFGSCNGWAAAATQFVEPEPIVVNGVKLFSSEVKAILATIWKDNVENPQGEYDAQGITAQSFEQVLYQYLAQNRLIIFDVTLGLESWNYPVAGFTRNATENGEWTDVTVDVRYTNTVPLALLDQDISESLAYLDKTYTYRFNSEGTYEWTGTSLTDRPQRAWYTEVPFLRTWYVRGNRHLNMNVYETLHAINDTESAEVDWYEPNNLQATAHEVSTDMVLASLTNDDTDFFQYHKLAGEQIALDFEVYDGPDVSLIVRDAQGNALEQHDGICELTISPSIEYEGDFLVEIASINSETSFYKMQHPLDRSSVKLTNDSPLVGGAMTVMNVRDGESQLAGDALENVAGNGGTSIDILQPDYTYRASGRTVWALENNDGERVYKRYVNEHERELPYIVPHLTCRNGWKTQLTLTRTNDAEVTLAVYAMDGTLMERVVVPNEDSLDIGALLSSEAGSAGTWFQLETIRSNRLSGYVTYSHEGINYQADFDLAGSPRNGEMLVTNLPKSGEGWVGLALVNTSGVLNPLRYRLRDGRGDLLAEGELELKPGEKWLGLPSHLVDMPIEDEYNLWIFSQFNLETLALRHDVPHAVDYAHRLPNPILDFSQETYVSLPMSGGDTQQFHITNPGQGANYITFRGMNAAGEEILFHRLGGEPFYDYDQRFYTMSDILTAAGVDPLNTDITHFKVTSSKPALISELVGQPGQPAKRHVKLVSVFDKQ